MKPIDRTIAISQIFILVAWEAVGIIAFDWPALTIWAVWFVGLWTFNVLTATAVRTYFKLITPGVVLSQAEPEITEEDIGG